MKSMKMIKEMKQMRQIMLSGIVLVLVISGLLVTVRSQSVNDKDSADGQGTLVNEDGSHSEFTFNVQRNPNGKVVGQATIRNPSFKKNNGQNNQIKIDVSCLKIVGNIAIIGGTTKRKDSQSKAEAVYFAVEGNSDAGRGADKIFRGFFYDDDPATDGDPQRCQSIEVDVPVFEPIAAGKIQVKAKKP